MREKRPGSEHLMDRAAQAVDNTLVPIACGVVSIAAIAQLLMAVPAIRALADRGAGRMLPVVAERAAAIASAYVRISVSPWPNPSDLQIQVNGQTYRPLPDGTITLQLRAGERIAVQRQRGQGIVYVTIDHDDPKLLVPAPGQSLEMADGQTSAEFPVAQFFP